MHTSLLKISGHYSSHGYLVSGMYTVNPQHAVSVQVQCAASVALSFCADSRAHAIELLKVPAGQALGGAQGQGSGAQGMCCALRSAVQSGWATAELAISLQHALEACAHTATMAGDASFVFGSLSQQEQGVESASEGDATLQSLFSIIHSGHAQQSNSSSAQAHVLTARHAAADCLARLCSADSAFAQQLFFAGIQSGGAGATERVGALCGALQAACAGDGDAQLYCDVAALVRNPALHFVVEFSAFYFFLLSCFLRFS